MSHELLPYDKETATLSQLRHPECKNSLAVLTELLYIGIWDRLSVTPQDASLGPEILSYAKNTYNRSKAESFECMEDFI